jgi:hypothetical protein
VPMQPRKVLLRGQVRWEVRIDQRLRKQEQGKVRALYHTQAEAQSYCKRLESDLRNYSDKARGLSDAQKIEAQTCFERLANDPAQPSPPPWITICGISNRRPVP